MATARTAWGIDIGQCAIKAVKLARAEEGLTVEAFDVIEHPQILSEEEADRRLLIRAGLDQFLSRNSIAGSTIAVAVPGQSSFTRFVKLPPVEPKRIPDIVRFEAEQQIPFPIEEVLWRWQTFHDPDSPDVEVGLFAMKRTDVAEMLGYFEEVAMPVDVVQMAPLALYNFMTFDEQLATEEATLLVDVGADKTDLVVADGGRIWTRTIQIGGTSFTQAIERAFKLRFAKADKLKRSAATSKYARQIFQSMRPVFSDLVQEIQRSVGYYASLHRDTRFKRLVGLGNGFRLPGLQKFLEQNLNIPVVRIDSFNKLQLARGVHAASFAENVLSSAVAYGLAAQALGVCRIECNLLPEEIAAKRVWAKKRPWFAVAAAIFLASLCGSAYRSYVDRQALGQTHDLATAEDNVRQVKTRADEVMELEKMGRGEQKQLDDELELYAYRRYWPEAQHMVYAAIDGIATDQRLLLDFAKQRNEAVDIQRRLRNIQAELPEQPAAPEAAKLADKRKALAGELAKVKARCSEFVTKGMSLGDRQKYFAAAKEVAQLDEQMAGTLTDVERTECIRKRFQLRKEMQDLVTGGFRNLRILRVESLRTEYVADVSALKARDEANASVARASGAPRFSGPKAVDITGRPTRDPASPKAGAQPGFKITVKGRTAMPQIKALNLLRTVDKTSQACVANSKRLGYQDAAGVAVVGEAPGRMVGREAGARLAGRPMGRPTAGTSEPQLSDPDPIIPDREMCDDAAFAIVWLITIKPAE